MSRWFRFYDETLNDPKILKLSDKLHRVWVGLLCVASKNEGKLPSLEDMSIMLRMSPAKLHLAIHALIEAELIDGEFPDLEPHNWNKRQYKSDVSNDRVKRHRERKCNVTDAVTVTPPEQIQNRTEQKADADEAGEHPLVSAEANRLSDQIATIVGHSLDFVPPAWCGAPWRVQTWLNEGWPPEIILASVKETMGRRRGDKPDRIQYFEKGIAEAIARQNKPLPTVKIIEGETVNVRRKTGSVIAATDRLIDKLKSFDAPIPDHAGTRSGEGATVVRMLPERGR